MGNLLGVFWKIIWATVVPLFLTYSVIPLCLWLFPSLHHSLVFLNWARWPFNNYSDLAGLGVVTKGRQFKLKTPQGPELGAWHILPKSLNSTGRLDGRNFEAFLGQADGRPIFLYFHGNSATRAQSTRVGTYNFLALQDFHVLTVDYRGFADSSGSPTETGVIADAVALYQWAREKADGNPIFLWGHSLGTGVCAGAAAELCKIGECPEGIVLESPFNNLAEIIRHHPFSRPYQWLPSKIFDYILVKPCMDQDLTMNTDERVKGVECPMLILHAEDDPVVPVKLAKELQYAARNAGRDVTFIEFDRPKKYGHKWIHRAPELADVIYEFVEKCLAGNGES